MGDPFGHHAFSQLPVGPKVQQKAWGGAIMKSALSPVANAIMGCKNESPDRLLFRDESLLVMRFICDFMCYELAEYATRRCCFMARKGDGA